MTSPSAFGVNLILIEKDTKLYTAKHKRLPEILMPNSKRELFG